MAFSFLLVLLHLSWALALHMSFNLSSVPSHRNDQRPQVSAFISCLFLLNVSVLKCESLWLQQFVKHLVWKWWFSHVWHTELAWAWGDGLLCLSQSSDDLTGAALIPASPEGWSPYPIYTPELNPGMPHAAFTYPAAAAAAAAALHAQVRESLHFAFLIVVFFSSFLMVFTLHWLFFFSSFSWIWDPNIFLWI